MKTILIGLAVGCSALIGATGIVDVAKVTGNGNISSFDFNLLPQRSFLAFGATFSGPVTVAAGDVNGDGRPDIVVGAGSGNPPRVRVFDGVNGALLRDFHAYNPVFLGGVRVAIQDVNADGYDDLITGTGAGLAAEVKVFSGYNNAPILDIFPDPAYNGGVFVAGATHGQGNVPLLVVGLDQQVKSFNLSGNLFRNFTPYSGYTGGVRVATGDVSGDGIADIVTGIAGGAAPNVKVFNGQTGSLIHSFFAFSPGFTGGTAVATGDVNGDGKDDILVGTASGGGTKSAFDGVSGSLIGSFMPFGPAYSGGIDVGSDNEHTGFPLRVTLNGPPTGTPVTIWTPDLDNLKDGPVPLTRLYSPNVQVNLTAPQKDQAGSLYFDKWVLDGNTLTTNRTATVTQNQLHSLVGVYLPGFDLSVGSTILGVPTTVYQPDENGAANGVTPFTRIYTQGTTVSLNTPVIVAPNYFFRRWDLAGSPWKATPTVSLPMSGDRNLVSVYEAGKLASVTSNAPGVLITVWTRDRGGAGSGTAPFDRLFAIGDKVSVTAPGTFNARLFNRWKLNGVNQPLGLRTLTIPSISSNSTLDADYAP